MNKFYIEEIPDSPRTFQVISDSGIGQFTGSIVECESYIRMREGGYFASEQAL